jgi:hypothetical protein
MMINVDRSGVASGWSVARRLSTVGGMSLPEADEVEIAAFRLASRMVDSVRFAGRFLALDSTGRERAVHERATAIARAIAEPRELTTETVDGTFTVRWSEPTPPRYDPLAREPVYYLRLGELMPVYHLNVTGEEATRIRRLYVAADREEVRRRSYGTEHRLDASAEDKRRWHAATEAVQAAMQDAENQENQAGLYQRRPWKFHTRIVWQIRYGRRNRRLRENHDATVERLRAMVLTAYRDFAEQAGDLTDRIEAEEKRRDQDRRDREEDGRRLRTIAMAQASAPLWAYGIRENAYRGRRAFEIEFLLLSPDLRDSRLTETGLTPEQVQTALTEERASHPYTIVHWGHPTNTALEEWHDSGSAKESWQELTGQPIDTFPRNPDDPPPDRQRFYGPSSNYFSPGFGGSF